MSLSQVEQWRCRVKSALFGGSLRRLIARTSSGSFAIEIGGAGIAFGLHILLARILGVDSYGVYVYVATWMKVAAIGGIMGFRTASIRFVGEYFGNQDWKRLRGFRTYSHWFVTIASFVVALFLVTIAYFYYGDRSSEHWWTFVFAAGTLIFLAHTQLREAELRGMKNVVAAQIPLRILRPLGIILGLGIAWFLGSRILASDAMAMNVVATGGALGVAVYMLRRTLVNVPVQEEPVFERDRWRAAARDMLLISGFGLLLQQTDILMLGALKDPTMAGQYSVASRLSGLLVFGLSAVNSALAPIIADLYAKGDHERLQRAITFGVRISVGFALLVGIGLWIFGVHLLLLFGTEFGVAYTALAILVLGQLGNACTGPSILVLHMVDYERASAVLLGASVLLNTGLNYVLILYFGMEGAAAATAITFVLFNFVGALVASMKRNLSTTIFG